MKDKSLKVSGKKVLQLGNEGQITESRLKKVLEWGNEGQTLKESGKKVLQLG